MIILFTFISIFTFSVLFLLGKMDHAIINDNEFIDEYF